MIFGGELLNIKYVFRFSLQFFLKHFSLQEELNKVPQECTHWFSCKVTVILVGFWRNWNSADRFSKNIQIKFYENPLSGSRVVPCGQTNGRTDSQSDMTKLIVASRNFAKAPKISTYCPRPLYVFCIYLRPNIDFRSVQHKLIGFYNRDEKCLQRGTNCCLKLFFK